MIKCTCTRPESDCQYCDKRIADIESQKLLDSIEPPPLKNDSLKERGNPDSRYYDGI